MRLFRVFFLDALLEKFLEDMVIAQPFPIRPHLQHEQIILPDCPDQILPIALAQNGRTQISVKLFQQGSLEHEIVYFGRLRGKNFLIEISGQVHTGRAGGSGQVRQTTGHAGDRQMQAGNPTFRLMHQSFHRMIVEGHAIGCLEKNADFVGTKGQFFQVKTAHLLACHHQGDVG